MCAGLNSAFLRGVRNLAALGICRTSRHGGIRVGRGTRRFEEVAVGILAVRLGSMDIVSVITCTKDTMNMMVTVVRMGGNAVALPRTFLVVVLTTSFFLPLELLNSFFRITVGNVTTDSGLFGLLSAGRSRRKTRVPRGLSKSVRVRSLSFSCSNRGAMLGSVSVAFGGRRLVDVMNRSNYNGDALTSLLYKAAGNCVKDVAVNNIRVGSVSRGALVGGVATMGFGSCVFTKAIERGVLVTSGDTNSRGVVRTLGVMGL